MAREPISDKQYNEWVDIVALLYYKHNLSKRKILEMFGGHLSEWTLSSVAARYKKEHPEKCTGKNRTIGSKN
jgi:hypothetical protein